MYEAVLHNSVVRNQASHNKQRTFSHTHAHSYTLVIPLSNIERSIQAPPVFMCAFVRVWYLYAFHMTLPCNIQNVFQYRWKSKNADRLNSKSIRDVVYNFNHFAQLICGINCSIFALIDEFNENCYQCK